MDPWLAPEGSIPPYENWGIQKNQPLIPLKLTTEEIMDVDVVIVTHLHFDHFDKLAADEIKARNLTIISQDEIDAKLITERFGITNIIPMPKDNKLEYKGVTIFKIDCDHGDPKIWKNSPDRRDAMGFVLSSPLESKKLYLAGDTVYCQFVKDAIEKFKPEVIIINCCEATLPQGPLIMGIDGIRQIHKDTPDSKLVIIHIDAVCHMVYTRADIIKFAADEKLEEFVLVPDDGETLEF